MLRGIPDERGDQRAVQGADLSAREGWQVARAARCTKHRGIRQASRTRLTGRGRETPRFTGHTQVRVLVHHSTGLRDQQCERDKHAEPRGLAAAGQELGLCHTCKYRPGVVVCPKQETGGMARLLANYEHLPAASPYRSRCAIYVRENATRAHPEVNELPQQLRPNACSTPRVWPVCTCTRQGGLLCRTGRAGLGDAVNHVVGARHGGGKGC